jgi:RNA polymerase sigma-70 factor (ECF subfamily)
MQQNPEQSQRHSDGRVLDVSRLPDHWDRLFRAAYALCGNRADAEDLVQDTYARVLRRPRLIRRDEDLSYLLKAMRNTLIDRYRARALQPEMVEFDETIDFVLDPGADPAVSLVAVQVIYAAIRELSPPLRETIVAVDVVELSYSQAARALGVPIGTIMSRLYRARNQVAKRLEANGAETPRSGRDSVQPPSPVSYSRSSSPEGRAEPDFT